ncbi:Uncharacterized protein APZ42_018686 [Daphnia magna]|uniref:Uncharacterized protein n=1 Tax=Daphnia magna TaxID=35525 RepID=A0A164YRI0_9CRUS|nr:Uncharacterized protein APZ42_018686 [Daphnia magna]
MFDENSFTESLKCGTHHTGKNVPPLTVVVYTHNKSGRWIETTADPSTIFHDPFVWNGLKYIASFFRVCYTRIPSSCSPPISVGMG